MMEICEWFAMDDEDSRTVKARVESKVGLLMDEIPIDDRDPRMVSKPLFL